jgi:hypothetical protein
VNCRPLKPSPRSICPAAPYPTGVHIPGIPPPAKFATEPEIGPQGLRYRRRPARNLDRRAPGRSAKFRQPMPPLLEEIEGEFEIPFIQWRGHRDFYGRHVSGRGCRQGRRLNETRPMNRAVTGPPAAQAKAG